VDDERMPEAFPTRGGSEPAEGTDEPTLGPDLDEASSAGEEVAKPGFDPERQTAGAGVPNVDADDPAVGGGSPPSAGRDAPQGGIAV